MIVLVNWLTLWDEFRWAVILPIIVPPVYTVHFGLYIQYTSDCIYSTLRTVYSVHFGTLPPVYTLIRDLGRVSDWCAFGE